MTACDPLRPVADKHLSGTNLTSKQRHTQAKKFLDEHVRHEKYIRQCVLCQKIGYDEEKLRERSEALFRKQIRSYYKPIVLDSMGRCEECSNRGR